MQKPSATLAESGNATRRGSAPQVGPASQPKTLLIGLGHPWRSDDAAGLWVVGAVAKLTAAYDVRLVSDGAQLMEDWVGYDEVVIVDALRPLSSRDVPGAIARLAPADCAAAAPWSSHAFGLVEALTMGEALAQLPRSITIFGIYGEDFRLRQGLSPPVAAAVARLAKALADAAARGQPVEINDA